MHSDTRIRTGRYSRNTAPAGGVDTIKGQRRSSSAGQSACLVNRGSPRAYYPQIVRFLAQRWELCSSFAAVLRIRGALFDDSCQGFQAPFADPEAPRWRRANRPRRNAPRTRSRCAGNRLGGIGASGSTTRYGCHTSSAFGAEHEPGRARAWRIRADAAPLHPVRVDRLSPVARRALPDTERGDHRVLERACPAASAPRTPRPARGPPATTRGQDAHGRRHPQAPASVGSGGAALIRSPARPTGGAAHAADLKAARRSPHLRR